MKKLFTLLLNAVSNIHNIHAQVEKAYALWTGFYDYVSPLLPSPAGAAAEVINEDPAPAPPVAAADPARPQVSLL